MRVLAMIVTCLLIPLGPSFGARSEDQRVIWNWAWREATSELFAYSSDGETALLLTGVSAFGQLWRVSDDQAVGLLAVDGELGFYEVTSQSAQAFTANFDMQTLEVPLDTRFGYRLEGYGLPYLVFAPAVSHSSPSSEPALLLNLETREIELLTNDAFLSGCCRFTEDGQRLRYAVSSGDLSNQTLILRERILATGEEHDLHTFGGEYPLFFADRYGDRWLLLIDGEVGADGTLPYEMFNINGVSERLPQTYSDGYTSYEFFGNDLISYQPLCSVDCPLRLLTPDGNSLTFELPAEIGGQSIDMLLRYDKQLVVGNANGYWLLSTDNKPTLISYNYRGGSHLPPDISPDGRWLLVTDTQEYATTFSLSVWDLVRQEAVVELSGVPEQPVFMIYDVDGFIVRSLDVPHDGVLYRYSDAMTFQLPDGAIYFDVLPESVGGGVLYERYGQLDTGIYRYDPDDDTSTQLIDNASRIMTVDVDYIEHPMSQLYS